jgi:hypothetical protein
MRPLLLPFEVEIMRIDLETIMLQSTGVPTKPLSFNLSL